MADKKELKENYKQIKPEMGVFVFKCLSSGKAYLGISQNIRAKLNSLVFQLNIGSYNKNENLQSDWKKCGEKGFEIAISETLKYIEDESKTDYSGDLRILRDFCAEKYKFFEYIDN